MDALGLALAGVLSALISALFGYIIKKGEGKTAEKNTRAIAEEDAFVRAQGIYERALQALEREASDRDAEIEHLKLQLKEKK